MCGIAGIFSPSLPDAELRRMAKLMSATLRHRGPDDEGFTCFYETHSPEDCYGDDTANKVKDTYQNLSSIDVPQVENSKLKGILLHRRLSIIDLSEKGHQPMWDAQRRYYISFNGEIYNFKSLKNELKLLGYQFKSETDTEVLLYAFIHWGAEVVHRLNGMWAFAVYDSHQQRLFLCRDRLGVKPLYFANHSGDFVFASEQKAILAIKSECRKLNPEAVFDFFTIGRIESGQENFFCHIKELPPGHYLFFDTFNYQITCLEQWFRTEMLQNKSISEQPELEVFEALKKAVKLRMQADVEVATCLSGGLDSSSILMLMHHLKGNDRTAVKAFTASFEDTAIDESRYAEKVVNASDAGWFIVKPNAQNLLSDFESLTYCQDIPLWSTSTYAQFKVMERVKQQGVKVVLDGQGGDELFGGYHSHRLTYALELKKQCRIVAANQIHPLLSGNMVRFVLKNAMERYGTPDVRLWFYQNFFKGLSFLKKDFLHAYKYRFYELHSLPIDNLRKRLDAELFNRNLKSYLITEDRCSMWHSVESRTPFSDDPELIALARSIPANRLIDQTYGKKILREAMQNLLPSEICWRKDKLGFQTPNNQWLREISGYMKPLLMEHLPNDIFDLEKIASRYDEYFNPTYHRDDGSVFKFHSFAMWVKIFGMKA